MIWHTLVIMMQNVCFCGMIQDNLVISVQKSVFLWYDATYLSKNGTKCLFLW